MASDRRPIILSVVAAGKRRKNFRITANGKKVLAEARAKLRELVSEVVDDKDRRAAK